MIRVTLALVAATVALAGCATTPTPESGTGIQQEVEVGTVLLEEIQDLAKVGAISGRTTICSTIVPALQVKIDQLNDVVARLEALGAVELDPSSMALVSEAAIQMETDLAAAQGVC